MKGDNTKNQKNTNNMQHIKESYLKYLIQQQQQHLVQTLHSKRQSGINAVRDQNKDNQNKNVHHNSLFPIQQIKTRNSQIVVTEGVHPKFENIHTKGKNKGELNQSMQTTQTDFDNNIKLRSNSVAPKGQSTLFNQIEKNTDQRDLYNQYLDDEIRFKQHMEQNHNTLVRPGKNGNDIKLIKLKQYKRSYDPQVRALTMKYLDENQSTIHNMSAQIFKEREIQNTVNYFFKLGFIEKNVEDIAKRLGGFAGLHALYCKMHDGTMILPRNDDGSPNLEKLIKNLETRDAQRKKDQYECNVNNSLNITSYPSTQNTYYNNKHRKNTRSRIETEPNQNDSSMIFQPNQRLFSQNSIQDYSKVLNSSGIQQFCIKPDSNDITLNASQIQINPIHTQPSGTDNQGQYSKILNTMLNDQNNKQYRNGVPKKNRVFVTQIGGDRNSPDGHFSSLSSMPNKNNSSVVYSNSKKGAFYDLSVLGLKFSNGSIKNTQDLNTQDFNTLSSQRSSPLKPKYLEQADQAKYRSSSVIEQQKAKPNVGRKK